MINNYENENGFFSDELFKIEDKELLLSKVHRSIGALSYRGKTGKQQWGSGVLISKNMVLTSARCVYNQTQRANYKYIKFYLQAWGSVSQEFEVESAKCASLYMYRTNKEQLVQHGYAVLKLKRPVRESLTHNQFLPLIAPCQICSQNLRQEIEIYGFPIRENSRSQNNIELYQQGLSKSDILSQIEIESNWLMYYMEGKEGQNGCPIIANEKIIGIHLGMQINPRLHAGRLVTSYLLTNIRAWCQQLKGDAPTILKCEHDYRKQKISNAESMTSHGKQSFVSSSYKQALIYFEQGLNDLVQVGMEEGVEAALIMKWIGNSYYRLNIYTRAAQYLRRSLAIFKKYNIRDINYSQGFYWLGMAEKKMGNFEISLQAFQDSLQVDKIKGKQFIAHESAKEIVSCLLKLNRFQQAKQIKAKYKLEIDV